MSRMNDPQSAATEAKGAAGQVVEQVKEHATQIAGKISDAATEGYEHLRDTASEYYEQGREKAMHWQEELENYVTEQPMKSILIAAGVGVLVGILWKHS